MTTPKQEEAMTRSPFMQFARQASKMPKGLLGLHKTCPKPNEPCLHPEPHPISACHGRDILQCNRSFNLVIQSKSRSPSPLLGRQSQSNFIFSPRAVPWRISSYRKDNSLKSKRLMQSVSRRFSRVNIKLRTSRTPLTSISKRWRPQVSFQWAGCPGRGQVSIHAPIIHHHDLTNIR